MMLTAWPQVAAPGELQLWVGLFGADAPAPPTFAVDGQPAEPLQAALWSPIRDRRSGAQGRPINHQSVVRLRAKGPGQSHRIRISVAGQSIELRSSSLPAAVPSLLDGSFNILLCSCYYQPEDAGGLLGRIVARLPVKPHLTLLAGDQVYLDLPLLEDLPEDEPALSQALGDKYRRNWLSDSLGVAGLQPVLAQAPTACIADDHEFWNNYPFRQAQLPNTWHDGPRGRWAAAAQALFEDFQIGGPPGPGAGAGASASTPTVNAPASRRIDIEPLMILLLDTRCSRQADFNGDTSLMTTAAGQALDAWCADLLAARASGAQRVGVLATGQALFIDRPGDAAKKLADAELANYPAPFAHLQKTLGTLADAGVPVVFLTGDVHWSRIASAQHLPSGNTLLYEVICSPARLIATPLVDAEKLLGNRLKNLFGRGDVWPRHSNPPPIPARFGDRAQFVPKALYQRKGDCVALLRFCRAGHGLEMQVSYYPIHPDASAAQPDTRGPFALLAR